MITENVSTLKINKMTQAQYNRELAAGNIKDNEIYLTPIEEVGVEDISDSFVAISEDISGCGIKVYKYGNIVSGTITVFGYFATNTLVQLLRINSYAPKQPMYMCQSVVYRDSDEQEGMDATGKCCIINGVLCLRSESPIPIAQMQISFTYICD